MGLLDAHLITEIIDVVTVELGTVPHPQLLGPLAPPLPLRTQLGVKQFSLTEGAEDEEATKVTTALYASAAVAARQGRPDLRHHPHGLRHRAVHLDLHHHLVHQPRQPPA